MLARVRTPSHRSERERERKKGWEREKRGREIRVIKRERERERCRICPEFLSLFLKGMTGALAPFI
jgi:hypothetical protein